MIVPRSKPDPLTQRKSLLQRPECQLVKWDEFQRLLLSRRRLERADHGPARLFGLRDRLTGQTFLVEQEKYPEPRTATATR